MSALGHVWTAPWQELSDAAGAFVGCDHVSGLFVRLVRPLALMLCAVRCLRAGAVHSSKNRCSAKRHVCLTPESDIKCDKMECPLCAKSGLLESEGTH